MHSQLCVPFRLPRTFYYRMMLNDISLTAGVRVHLVECTREHRSPNYFPRHRYQLIVNGICSDRAVEIIREKLERYRNLARSFERPQSTRRAPAHR
jgi:hypothetical protein